MKPQPSTISDWMNTVVQIARKMPLMTCVRIKAIYKVQQPSNVRLVPLLLSPLSPPSHCFEALVGSITSFHTFLPPHYQHHYTRFPAPRQYLRKAEWTATLEYVMMPKEPFRRSRLEQSLKKLLLAGPLVLILVLIQELAEPLLLVHELVEQSRPCALEQEDQIAC